MTENDTQKAEPDCKSRGTAPSYSFGHYLFVRPDHMTRHNSNSLLHPFHHDLVKDDGDNCSVISESGLSDISHNTDVSISSVVERKTVKDRLDHLTLKKNFSCADMVRLNEEKSKETQQSVDKNFKQPQRLPSVMLWNWISSHKYNTPAITVTDSKCSSDNPAQPAVESSLSKARFTMRDLNAYAPTAF